MSQLERITVTMPAEMVAKLRAAVEAGQYATTSEVVREALRDWSEEQDRIDAENATVRTLLDEARRSGSRPAEEVFADVLEYVRQVARSDIASRPQ